MREIEWQFDAVELGAVVRWLEARRASDGPSAAVSSGTPSVVFSPLEPRRITDTYLDTSDWRFHRAGLALRLRRRNGALEANLKSLEPAQNGLRDRIELSSPVPSSDPSAVFEAASRAGDWIRSLAGRSPLRPLFTLGSTRRAYAILVGGEPAGEIVLDETSYERLPPGEPLRLKRVEVEVAEPSVESLRPFVEDLRAACRLAPASASKFEVGLLTLEEKPAGLPDVGPLTVPEAPTMGELGFAVLRRSFLELLRNEAGTRLGEVAEPLHDMRVSIRRLRAALALFEPALPKRSRNLGAELRWIAGLLGDVRDLDTQLASLAAWVADAAPDDAEALQALGAALGKRRQRARQRMLRGLDSRRYRCLQERLIRLLRAGPRRRSAAARTPALDAFPELIERRHSSVRKAAKGLSPESPAEAYHRLRIRGKRLRYAVENSCDLYGAAASEFADVLVGLQDLLGLHQDSVVAVARLQELLESRARRLPPRAIFVMGRAAQQHEHTAAKLRKRFDRVYPRVEGKAWMRLKRMMARLRRPTAGAWPRAAASTASAAAPTAEG